MTKKISKKNAAIVAEYAQPAPATAEQIALMTAVITEQNAEPAPAYVPPAGFDPSLTAADVELLSIPADLEEPASIMFAGEPLTQAQYVERVASLEATAGDHYWDAVADAVADETTPTQPEIHDPVIEQMTETGEPWHHIETLSDEPTAAEIEAALAQIDPDMETAIAAGAIDHASQMNSWAPVEALAEQKETRDLEEAVNYEMGVEPEVTLDNLIAKISDDEAKVKVFHIARQLDIREAFQIEKADLLAAEKGGEPSLNILKTLKAIRQQMVTLRAAKLFSAIKVDPDFMNRSIHAGACYNVYAIPKVADIVYGVTNGVIRNAINIACMKTLFRLHDLEIPMTMEVAKSAASKQYGIKHMNAAIRAHLISHTVAEGTASTQASSTMQALCTLGVVSSNNVGKNPTFTLNADAPITKKLRELIAA